MTASSSEFVPRRREINALTERVLALPDTDKFEIFELIRADLTAKLSVDDLEVRLVKQRQEAISAIRKVAEHLRLEPGETPTVGEFDGTTREIGLEWRSGRVINLWERWTLACDAFLGRRRIDTPSARILRKRNLSGSRPAETYIRGMKVWLKTEPEDLTEVAYEAWARAHNLSRAGHQTPVVRPAALRNKLSLPWAAVISVARGEKSLEQAREDRLASILPPRRPNAIVGLRAASMIIGMSYSGTVRRASADRRFPTPVARIQGRPAWLLRDMQLYAKHRPVLKRKLEELQSIFIDVPELRERLRLTNESLRDLIRRKRWGRVPEPEGAIGSAGYYWRRETVEAWLGVHAKRHVSQTRD